MMINITGPATRNRVTVYTVVMLVAIYGIISYFGLPKKQDPGFTIRAAVISTQFPGASPSRVENLVTDKIEQAVKEMPELDNVVSESTPGFSFVTANFKESYTDMRPIFDKLRRKIDAVQGLPDGIRGPNVNDEYGDVFGSVYALTGEGYSFAELKDIADDIRDELLRLNDVAKVEIQGVQDEEIFVEYNHAKLRELGVSPQQLSQILAGVNIIQGGGSILTGTERITLEPSGNFESLTDLKRTVIQIPDSNRIVYLEDIASVYRDYVDPPDGFASYKGIDALILAISLREGGNILELGTTLQSLMPDIEASYPYGIALHPVYLESLLVDRAVNSFMSNLLQAIIIVVAVMLVFLGLRTGLIVGMLVPFTIFSALMVMNLLGITINQISLAALIISLGLLVDNAIVIAESILVKREGGENAVDAAVAAGREMAMPLLTSSLTTAAAFLPIFLAESAVGEYTADIFKVVSIALLCSWFLALSFIPLLTITFLKVKSGAKAPTYDSLLYRVYQGFLTFAVRNRTIFLVLTGAIFYSAIWALQFVPSVFIPPKTDPVITGTLTMPRGTAIETTRAVGKDIENFIRLEMMAATHDHVAGDSDVTPEPGVVSWAMWIGESAPRYTLALDPGANEPGSISVLMNTTDHLVIPEMIRRVRGYARQVHPDLDIQLSKLENGTPIPYPIEVRVSGKDIDALYEIINTVKDKLVQTTGILSVTDDWGPRSKKLLINVDQDRARRAGVSNQDIAVSLQSGLSGIELTQFREGEDLIPVTMRSVASDRQDVEKLSSLTIYSQSSNQGVPLSQVADLEIAWQPGIIKRRNRNLTIAAQAQLLPGVTATDVNESFLPWLEQYADTWPDKISYELGGESETSGDANQAIADKLPIAGMLIFLLLVTQFNSVRSPLLILLTIPLGLVGVTYGLLIANSVFGFFTILGIISLSGIVINNAIVLLDRIKIEIEENGLSPQEAVYSACKQRLRPILLTTATTIGGMLPLWISRDPMFETMAVTIMFGLLFATLLTLLFVPVLYSLFFRVKFSK
ncbi:MAG: efflux RND transporter permease subunit [Pseudomonadota bacterium]